MILLFFVPTTVISTVLSDATMSDFEFGMRVIFFVFQIGLVILIMVLDVGGVLQDTESYVVSLDTTFESSEGLWVTTASAIALLNATSPEQWATTLHFDVRSTGFTRFVLVMAYLLVHTIKSVMQPHEVCTTVRTG